MIIVKTINLSPTKPIKYVWDKFQPTEIITRDTFATNPAKKSFEELLYSISFAGVMTVPSEPMKERIWDAFMPIIEVIQGISLPLSFVVLATSICLIIVGQKRQGMQMAKWAVIGFIAMQWLPSFMRILSEVGEAMGK
jgi:hypothetical protein